MFTPLLLAKKLKKAGLDWQPKLHDFFMIPDVGMDERVFVLSDMTVDRTVLHGHHAITFVGAVEWALDYIFEADAIWLPTEGQLRHLLQVRLAKGKQPTVVLHCAADGFTCFLNLEDGVVEYAGIDAAEAYGEALLSLL